MKHAKTFPDDCLMEKDVPPSKDNFTTLLHPTLQTNSLFLVYRKWKILLYIYYIYTHTPYMLNTVNISPLYVEFLLQFMARDCTPFISLLFKHTRVKEQNKRPVRGRNDPLRML